MRVDWIARVAKTLINSHQNLNQDKVDESRWALTVKRERVATFINSDPCSDQGFSSLLAARGNYQVRFEGPLLKLHVSLAQPTNLRFFNRNTWWSGLIQTRLCSTSLNFRSITRLHRNARLSRRHIVNVEWLSQIHTVFEICWPDVAKSTFDSSWRNWQLLSSVEFYITLV